VRKSTEDGAPPRIGAPAIHLRLIDEARASRIERRTCPTEDRWAPGYPTDGDVEAAALALRAMRAGRELGAFGTYEILEEDSGDVVGGIGFHGAPRQDGSVEVGYSVATSRQGRGYATAALVALVRIAEHAGAQLVEARAAPANSASRRVLEKAGFSYRDLADGYVRYALDLGGRSHRQ
jgi:RimJ/RimL family protein N-acetyltransferase